MPRRWLMLALGTAAQTAACAFVYGVPYLAATLRDTAHLTLPQIGLLIACPTAGLVAALVAWGAAADRYGERVVIATGLGGAAALLAVAAGAVGAGGGTTALGALLALAGAAGASVYSASGRLVMGWFSAGERGLAMGIRQTATPLGMGVAALTMPRSPPRTGCTAPSASWPPCAGSSPAWSHCSPPTRYARGPVPARRRRPTLPGLRDLVADPRRGRAAGRTAVHGGGLRPGAAGGHPGLVPGRRRPADRRRTGAGGLLPDRRRALVGPGRQPAAADAATRRRHHRGGRRGGRDRGLPPR